MEYFQQHIARAVGNMQPTVREEEEEDPDITFNFKGDNREMVFEETAGAIFKVDSEITFNFRSPQTLLGDGENEERKERNRNGERKKRYTDEEDASILTYLDHHWMIKPARRSEKKCSKIFETEEVFRRMEVDKVLEGRSWKSLKQRWNSVLKWRHCGEKEIR